MHLWGITIKPIIFAAVAVPTLVIGVIIFKPFTPGNIDQQGLSPVRDLVGTWEGTMTYGSNGPCTNAQYLMRLIINTQTDTAIVGTVSYIFKKDHPSGWCGSLGEIAPVPASAAISGSRLTNIDFGPFLAGVGTNSGSFTTDTITIDRGKGQQEGGQFFRLTAPINLLRKE